MAVLDSSFTIAVFAPDEADASSGLKFRDLLRFNIFVPAIWSIEIINVMINKQRRSGWDVQKTAEVVDLMLALPVQLDVIPLPRLRPAIWAIAGQHRLSAYDASYLELAIRTGGPLATLDRALATAARSEGIEVI